VRIDHGLAVRVVGGEQAVEDRAIRTLTPLRCPHRLVVDEHLERDIVVAEPEGGQRMSAQLCGDALNGLALVTSKVPVSSDLKPF
jgi:hypothetical protein